MSKSKSKSLSKKALVNELLMVLKVGGGMLTGTVLVNTAKKLLRIDSSANLPKRLLAPAAVTAAGAVVSIMSKNPSVKQIAVGVGAGGGIQGAKAVFPNAPMLQGLGSSDDEHLGLTPTSAIAQGEDWVYRDSSGHLAFPELGEVQSPATSSGHFIDAPAYLGESRDDAGMLGIEDAQIL